MTAVFPVAVSALVAGVDVRVVGDDVVPEEEQRLIEARGAVTSRRLRVEEPRPAGKRRGHDGPRIFLVDDQGTAGVAACGDPLMRQRCAVIDVEVEAACARSECRL